MITLGTTNLIQLLIDVVVLGIIAAIVFWIVNLIPIPQPWKNIALALVGLIFLLVVLNALGWHL